MSTEAMKLALDALEGSTDKTLSIRAITALREALAEQPAPMSQPNRVIAYSAATKLRELGYEWVDGAWRQPAQPQQEPVAWMTQARNFVHPMEFTEEEAKSYGWKAVYTSPPARKPLTDEEIETVWRSVQANDFHDCVKPFARAIEAAHGIKENP